MYGVAGNLIKINVCTLWIYRWYTSAVSLTDRFHVAVHLFRNRSNMTSKFGKNKKVAHDVIVKCVTVVLTKLFAQIMWKNVV